MSFTVVLNATARGTETDGTNDTLAPLALEGQGWLALEAIPANAGAVILLGKSRFGRRCLPVRQSFALPALTVVDGSTVHGKLTNRKLPDVGVSDLPGL